MIVITIILYILGASFKMIRISKMFHTTDWINLISQADFSMKEDEMRERERNERGREIYVDI